MNRLVSLAAVSLVLAAAVPATAAETRLMLANQSDWVAHRGFVIDIENNTAADGKSKLSTLKMAAGIADGHDWHYLTATPTWTLGHTYRCMLAVDGAKATLAIDGTTVGTEDTGFMPNPGSVIGNMVPDWANAPADYSAVQTKLEIDDATGKYAIPIPSAGAAALFGGTSVDLETWHYTGKPFQVHFAFRLDKPVDPSTYYPLVDKYGQPTFADYSGKVKSDADLKAVITKESKFEKGWAESSPYDKYGGLRHATWRDKSTGYYHLVRHKGYWWLIDPTGSPLFYTGVCTVAMPAANATPVSGRENMFAWLPAKGTEFAPALSENIWGSEPGTLYVSFDNANLIRKYGANWTKKATEVEQDRLRAWGFSGLGKWAAQWPGVPSIPVLNAGSVPNLVRHPDIFDPQIRAQVKQNLANQITPDLHNAAIVGWSYGNEFDEVFTLDEIRQILKKPADNPSRKALVDYAVAHLYGGDASKAGALSTASDDDIEKLRQFYADKFYALIHDDVKAIDPNHLFLGWWLVPYWWQNANDWKLQAAHVDVLGIDYYNQKFQDPQLLQWIRDSRKPILIGEYSFPPTFGGTRGFGNFQSSVTTTAEEARAYTDWIHATASNPGVVGVCWFEMRDEPFTGRGPGHGSNAFYSEHYAFGLVDVTDTPRWPLVDAAHALNRKATSIRQRASEKAH